MFASAKKVSSGYDYARAIWLPESREHVVLCLAAGERLPGRVTERKGSCVLVAFITPFEGRRRDVKGLVLEYTNPCGRVRLTGRTALVGTHGDRLLRLDKPELIEVVQDREYVRVEVECPARLVSQERCFETSTIDLSAGGMLIADPLELNFGESVEFQLTLVPGTAPVLGTARVVRFAGDLPAVEFTSVSDADRWRLLRFSLERLRAASPSGAPAA